MKGIRMRPPPFKNVRPGLVRSGFFVSLFLSSKRTGNLRHPNGEARHVASDPNKRSAIERLVLAKKPGNGESHRGTVTGTPLGQGGRKLRILLA
jgi:hypothetical protein